jgi:hypothetical protein
MDLCVNSNRILAQIDSLTVQKETEKMREREASRDEEQRIDANQWT